MRSIKKSVKTSDNPEIKDTNLQYDTIELCFLTNIYNYNNGVCRMNSVKFHMKNWNVNMAENNTILPFDLLYWWAIVSSNARSDGTLMWWKKVLSSSTHLSDSSCSDWLTHKLYTTLTRQYRRFSNPSRTHYQPQTNYISI